MFSGENAKPVVETETEKRNITTVDTLMDLVRNLFPENIIQAAVEKVQTVSIYPGKEGSYEIAAFFRPTRAAPFKWPVHWRPLQLEAVTDKLSGAQSSFPKACTP